jgi:hypothetical protein
MGENVNEPTKPTTKTPSTQKTTSTPSKNSWKRTTEVERQGGGDPLMDYLYLKGEL